MAEARREVDEAVLEDARAAVRIAATVNAAAVALEMVETPEEVTA